MSERSQTSYDIGYIDFNPEVQVRDLVPHPINTLRNNKRRFDNFIDRYPVEAGLYGASSMLGNAIIILNLQRYGEAAVSELNLPEFLSASLPAVIAYSATRGSIGTYMFLCGSDKTLRYYKSKYNNGHGEVFTDLIKELRFQYNKRVPLIRSLHSFPIQHLVEVGHEFVEIPNYTSFAVNMIVDGLRGIPMRARSHFNNRKPAPSKTSWFNA